jgi:hypothetical protein
MHRIRKVEQLKHEPSIFAGSREICLIFTLPEFQPCSDLEVWKPQSGTTQLQAKDFDIAL